jgi:folate-binding protein YgfZ
MTMTTYSSIRARGDDAFDFLQGQLTNDLQRLDGSTPILSAWCNPKGRVICLFRVREADDGFDLALPESLAQTVLDRLTMFRFRAKVDLSTGDAEPAHFGIGEPVEEWLLANLRNGIPEIFAATSEAFTPHMLNLDLLDAISLDKGCYTGQEIVARTHYRGATKRRMLRFESSAPVGIGNEIFAGERKVGDVVNAIGTDVLGVVPMESADDKLTIGDATLERRPIPYLDD